MNRRNYKLGKGSLSKLATTEPVVQELVKYTLQHVINKRKLHCPDFSITYGKRTQREQFDLYMIGRKRIADNEYKVVGTTVTNCDGIIRRSAHQSGLAIDFCAWVDGKANFDAGNLALIATAFLEAAQELGIQIEWGGNYNSISDGCHIEVVKYNKQDF